MDRAVEAHVALEADLLAGLSARERDRLPDLLRRLGVSIEAHAPGVKRPLDDPS